MSWWGKALGGAFGFMIGGPLGALLGAAFGHNFDRGLSGLKLENVDIGNTERVQSAFFTATFATMGHLAKADGQVSESEIQLAKQIMAQMDLGSDQEEIAVRLFNEGKRSSFKLDDVINQFRHECHGRRNLIQMFLEIQIATTLADGEFHPQERKVLLHIGDKLGFPQSTIEQLVSMIQAQRQYAGGRRSSQQSGPSLADAYTVLGVKTSDSDADIKKAYRRLMNQHHPDKLVAKGLPEEMMKIATEKTQEIKLAYEQIKASRKSH